MSFKIARENKIINRNKFNKLLIFDFSFNLVIKTQRFDDIEGVIKKFYQHQVRYRFSSLRCELILLLIKGFD